MKRGLLLILLFFGLAFAGPQDLTQALQSLCVLLFDVVSSLAMVMVLLSSVSYAASQMFSAEMRARMLVWSQSLLQGAFIGMIMIVLVPWLLGVMIGKAFNATSCTFT